VHLWKIVISQVSVITSDTGSLTLFDLNGGYSTKFSALLQDIESQEEWEKRFCPNFKPIHVFLKALANYILRSIVFSAWKKSLDLIACLLYAKAIPFATIDGSLSLPERRKVLSSFKSKPEIKTLLMTFGTGAVG
jgi:SWI/SNF-related matrix-associated actin-dependent regulator of chromatin subfamily A3